jgi:oligopeptide/dipeptide ABC transporter ATP-binding protein
MHPYTQGLMNSIPSVSDRRARLEAIPGIVPSPFNWPSGCRFRTRCNRAEEDCAAAPPQLVEVEPGHWVSCIKVASSPMSVKM